MTARSSLMAAPAAKRWGLTPTCRHLARTNCHGDGRFNRDEEPVDQIMQVTRGSRRDQRPERTQVRRDRMVEPQAGLPVLQQPLRGHRREVTNCGQVVRDPLAPRPSP